MQARHTSWASRAIMTLARRRLFPSHGIMAFKSLEEARKREPSNFARLKS